MKSESAVQNRTVVADYFRSKMLKLFDFKYYFHVILSPTEINGQLF